jgi:hypothetical protein
LAVGFLRFLGRHIGASILGAFAVTLLTLGYADQAKNILTTFEPWQLQGSGALLFVISVVMILYHWDQDRERVARPTAAPSPTREAPATRLPPLHEEAAVATLPTPVQPVNAKRTIDRPMVGKSVTLAKLMNLYQDTTRIQADKAAEIYIGKWMQVTGNIKDITKLSGTQISVALGILVKPENMFHPDLMSTTWLLFDDGNEHLEALQAGESLTVLGQIDRIDMYSVSLKHCEIIHPD